MFSPFPQAVTQRISHVATSCRCTSCYGFRSSEIPCPRTTRRRWDVRRFSIRGGKIASGGHSRARQLSCAFPCTSYSTASNWHRSTRVIRAGHWSDARGSRQNTAPCRRSVPPTLSANVGIIGLDSIGTMGAIAPTGILLRYVNFLSHFCMYRRLVQL